MAEGGLEWEIENGKARIDPLTIAFFPFSSLSFKLRISSLERLFVCLPVQYFSLLPFSLSYFFFFIPFLLAVRGMEYPDLNTKPGGKSLQCTTILPFFGVFNFLFSFFISFCLL